MTDGSSSPIYPCSFCLSSSIHGFQPNVLPLAGGGLISESIHTMLRWCLSYGVTGRNSSLNFGIFTTLVGRLTFLCNLRVGPGLPVMGLLTAVLWTMSHFSGTFQTSYNIQPYKACELCNDLISNRPLKAVDEVIEVDQ